MTQPPVLVLYNRPVLPADHPEAGSEHDIIDTVSDVTHILEAAGFAVRKLGIDRDPRPLLDELREHPPLAVFNLFEGLATQPSTEVSVAALLDWLNVSYTGCPTLSLALGNDKVRTKHLLSAAGLPTPAYAVIERLPLPPWDRWPAIVKPTNQDASVGIDQGSVVTDTAGLSTRVRQLLDRFGPPVLVEEFVAGREFHINMVEDATTGVLEMLPLAEIAFTPDRGQLWPIYTYTAKWDENSAEYAAAPLVVPVRLPEEPTRQLREIACRVFRLLHCRDYARLDVRIDSGGAFQVLEVNPNPYLNSLALVKGLEAVGRSHDELVVRMMIAALERAGHRLAPGLIKIPKQGPVIGSDSRAAG
jgi:D-alanine-D-alanine ligase